MPLDVSQDRTVTRQAMKAELLDAETELKLAYAWRDQRDEQALHRLINAYMRHFNGVEIPTLWRADERPHSRGRTGPDESRGQI